MRADGEIEINAEGHFIISNIGVGKHSGGHFTGHHNGSWNSMTDMLDSATGQAPSNISLSDSYRRRRIGAKGLAAVKRLRNFSAPLRYKGKFEGRIVKSYTVEDF